MRNKRLQFLSTFLFLAIFLTACNGQITVEPSLTPAPTSTDTPVPTSTPTTPPTSTSTTPPTLTSTITPTLPPTEAPVPQPASLTGTILLSGDTTQPFVSSVELRQKDSYNLIGKSDTDSNGNYKIENIDPGTYQLWVLITTKEAMIPGCTDVAPPNNKWRIGIKFGDDKALSMENAYLSKGLLLVQNLQTSDLKAQGFYAVLDGFKIKSGMENKMDVTLLCK
jgi:hypothetical protein